MATILDIADAVVTELNQATFSLPFTAERQYLPRFELPELTALKVTVVPRGLTIQAMDRGRDRFDFEIDVAVQQRRSLDTLDDLMDLTEEIADYFRKGLLASFPAARCSEVKNDPVYAADHLEELGQFTSVVTLTFQVGR